MSRQRFFAILRTLLSLAVASWAINFVYSKAGVNGAAEFRNCNYGWVATAFGLTMAGTALSSFRWCKLLRLQHVVLSHWDAFRLTMIGVFFNLVGLGGVGGDVLKMAYVRQHAGERTPEAVLSILVDRILGLLGLFLVTLIVLPFVWDELMHSTAAIHSMVGGVIFIAVLGGGGTALVLFRDLWLPTALKNVIRNQSRRFPARFVSIVARVVRSLDLYRNQVPELLKALAISGAIHTLAALAVCCLGLAFHLEGPAVRHYFVGTCVANTISAVPITPGGLGSRDVVLAEFLLRLGGDERANLVPPAFSGILVLWSLVGGLFFMAEKQVLKPEEVPSE